MRPLSHLLVSERLILEASLDNSFIPICTFHSFSPDKPAKPDKLNKLMTLMIATQQNQCILCGGHLEINKELRSDHPLRPSFDHVVSKSKGGLDRGNRIAAHRHCNSIKSDRDPTGCELIWLEVVNHAIERQSYLFHDRRT